MPEIGIDVNNNAKERLERKAEEMDMTLEAYIRYQLFGINASFTVDEAVRMIQAGDFDDQEKYPDGFSLLDVYGDGWSIPDGYAGRFGTLFYEHVINNPELGVVYKGKRKDKNGEHAYYIYKK